MHRKLRKNLNRGMIDTVPIAFFLDKESREEHRLLALINNKNMSNFNWKNVLFSLIVAVLTAVFGYILSIGDVWKLNLHSLVNIGIMSFIGAFLTLLGTTQKGNFAGIFPVKPSK